MDERTRAATYEDVRHVAELLEAEGVEYALIGGYALALQGIVRLTEDVDVLVEPTVENARRWIRALSKLPDGAAKELVGDDSVAGETRGRRSDPAGAPGRRRRGLRSSGVTPEMSTLSSAGPA